MADAAAGRRDARVDAVRAFNRFYTRQIGALGEHLLDGAYSLTETRVLYELVHDGATTATELGRRLGLDAGYLSRILKRFETERLLKRQPSPADARQSLLAITPHGRSALTPLEAQARAHVGGMLAAQTEARQAQIVDAMATIQRVLAPASATGTPHTGSSADDRGVTCLLRHHQPGDMGWVVQQHGAIYAREWRYDARFEALVARICANFLDHLIPGREQCWIAERDGAIVGCVFLVKKSNTVAKLRLLLVTPEARGLGLGGRLIEECVRFAGAAGYRKLTLWTQSELTAARRLYKRAGFVRVGAEPHDSFGRKHLVAETWELRLPRTRA